MNQSAKSLQNWVMNLDRRLYAALIGLSIGVIGGLVGLMLAVLGPLLTLVALVGLLAGLYILTDLTAALYGVFALMILLPFGTFPVDLGITPTLLDLALVAFLLVYLVQWMTGRRFNIQLTPPHILITLYLMWLVFAFMMGLRYGPPTGTILRDFVSSLLSVGMAYIVVDMLRDPQALRRLVLLIFVLLGTQAAGAIFLWLLPDFTANTLLNFLGRIEYPTGDVIRYIEANPALPERAIGTWVDPNALGGLLSVGAALIAPQLFAKRPVLRYRWLTLLVLALLVMALILTDSRASQLAFAGGLGIIVLAHYRRYIPILLLVASLLLFVPEVQENVNRIFQAFQGEDLATQMRIGEYTDSLALISAYPLFGIGFTGTPTNDLYTDVASLYLIMANQIGLVGVCLFVLSMLGVLWYGYQAWQYAKHNAQLASIHLGYQVALVTALVNAAADLYFFRLDFQSSITWFWLTVGLALASSRLVLQQATQSTVAPDKPKR